MKNNNEKTKEQEQIEKELERIQNLKSE